GAWRARRDFAGTRRARRQPPYPDQVQRLPGLATAAKLAQRLGERIWPVSSRSGQAIAVRVLGKQIEYVPTFFDLPSLWRMDTNACIFYRNPRPRFGALVTTLPVADACRL